MDTPIYQTKVKKKSSNKNMLIYITTVIMVCATIVSFSFGRLTAANHTSGTMYDETELGNNLVTQELLTEQIRAGINTYFNDANLTDVVSDTDVEELTAMITAEVLNSLPEDSLSETEENAVRLIVSDSVTSAISLQNDANKEQAEAAAAEAVETATSDVTVQINTANAETVSALKEYVKNTVVPKLTATIQLNAGCIDDLKTSLSALSTEYNTNKEEYDAIIDEIAQKLDTVGVNVTTQSSTLVEVKTDLARLDKVLSNYKSANATDIASVESEIVSIQSLLSAERAKREEQITSVKNDLSLLQSNITSMRSSIDELSGSTVTDIGDKLVSLTSNVSNIQDQLNTTEAALFAIINSGEYSPEIIYPAGSYVIHDGNLYYCEKATTGAFDPDKWTLVYQGVSSVSVELDAVYAALDEAIAKLSGNVTYDNKNGELIFTSDKAYKKGEYIVIEDQIYMCTKDVSIKEGQKWTEVSGNFEKTEFQAQDLTELTMSLADAKSQLSALVDDQIATLKSSLTAQISANKELTEQQKGELAGKINALSATTTSELNQQVMALQQEISAASSKNAMDLQAAIAKLLGGANGETTIQDLLDQIDGNAEYSDEVKASLVAMIQGLSSDTSASISSISGDVESLQNSLAAEVAKRDAAIQSAVGNLESSLQSSIMNLSNRLTQSEAQLEALVADQIETLKSALTAQIATNKSLADEDKTELINQINNLEVSTTEELNEQVRLLQEQVLNSSSASSEELQSALKSLLGGADADTTIQDLLNQISANTAYSDSTKAELKQLVSGLSTDTNAKLSSINGDISKIQEDLSAEVTARNEAIKEAVGTLRTTMNETISAIQGDMSNIQSDLSAVQGDVSTVQGNLSAVQGDVTNVQQNVDAINSSLQEMTTDVWISGFTISKSSFAYDGTYYACKLTNDGFKADSDVIIDYSTKTGFSVADYVQADGSLTIRVKATPSNDIVINSIHIQNKPAK